MPNYVLIWKPGFHPFNILIMLDDILSITLSGRQKWLIAENFLIWATTNCFAANKTDNLDCNWVQKAHTMAAIYSLNIINLEQEKTQSIPFCCLLHDIGIGVSAIMQNLILWTMCS